MQQPAKRASSARQALVDPRHGQRYPVEVKREHAVPGERRGRAACDLPVRGQPLETRSDPFECRLYFGIGEYTRETGSHGAHLVERPGHSVELVDQIERLG